MKPRKITIESERSESQKTLCDAIVERAAMLMVNDLGAPVPMIIDRLLTYAAALACTMEGSPNTATMFRKLANNIDAGCFHTVTGEDLPPDQRISN